jgi:hypothetical protein
MEIAGLVRSSAVDAATRFCDYVTQPWIDDSFADIPFGKHIDSNLTCPKRSRPYCFKDQKTYNVMLGDRVQIF